MKQLVLFIFQIIIRFKKIPHRENMFCEDDEH